MVYKDLMTVYEMNTRVSDMNENAAKEKNKQKIIKERDTLSRRLNTAKTLEEKQAISQQIRGLAEQLQKIEGN